MPVLNVDVADEHYSHAVRAGLHSYRGVGIPLGSQAKRRQELRAASATNLLRCLVADPLRHRSCGDKDRLQSQAALVPLADAAEDFAVPAVSVTSLGDAVGAALECDGALVFASAFDIGGDHGPSRRACGTAMGDVLEDFVKGVKLSLLLWNLTAGKASF